LATNKQHLLVPLLRPSISSRLAGYEDVNDADRLCVDPAMRHVVGGIATQLEKPAASASEVGRFESPRCPRSVEIANGLAFHHASVSLIETAQGSEMVATEYSVSSLPARTAAAMADGPTKGWIGMQPTEKKAARSPLTRPRQPQDDRKTKNELTERQS